MASLAANPADAGFTTRCLPSAHPSWKHPALQLHGQGAHAAQSRHCGRHALTGTKHWALVL